MPLTSQTFSFDPNRPDFAPYGLTCVRWRPSPMRRPDHHNEVELNLLESGFVTYLLGGRKVRFEPGRLNVFWAAIPHQIIDFDRNSSYFVATIPLQWFLQWRLPDPIVQPLLKGEVITEPAEHRAISDGQLFAHWEEDLRAGADAELRKAVLLEMEARFVRLCRSVLQSGQQSASVRKRQSGLSNTGLNKVEQMACLIAQRYTEKLTVEIIGREVKLHPNYAMSLFQKSFGSTLIEYLTGHRVSHAQRLLATTDMKIIDVAFSSGFNSISRFNDAFRQVCGSSPREYRQSHLLDDLVEGSTR
ncbi:MAG TPA: helix-turn-helix domain-containing protein [Opitutaceae bacterium]